MGLPKQGLKPAAETDAIAGIYKRHVLGWEFIRMDSNITPVCGFLY